MEISASDLKNYGIAEMTENEATPKPLKKCDFVVDITMGMILPYMPGMQGPHKFQKELWAGYMEYHPTEAQLEAIVRGEEVMVSPASIPYPTYYSEKEKFAARDKERDAANAATAADKAEKLLHTGQFGKTITSDVVAKESEALQAKADDKMLFKNIMDIGKAPAYISEARVVQAAGTNGWSPEKRAAAAARMAARLPQLQAGKLKAKQDRDTQEPSAQIAETIGMNDGVAEQG